jgi:TonB family protein
MKTLPCVILAVVIGASGLISRHSLAASKNKAPDPSKTPVTTKTPTTNKTPVPKKTVTPPKTVALGDKLKSKILSNPQPKLPDAARNAKVSGPVRVEVTVDEKGNVLSAKPLDGNKLLQQAAVTSARSAKFSPTKLSGQPVKVSGVITYNFVLQ